jgi:hypothetical protein
MRYLDEGEHLLEDVDAVAEREKEAWHFNNISLYLYMRRSLTNFV